MLPIDLCPDPIPLILTYFTSLNKSLLTLPFTFPIPDSGNAIVLSSASLFYYFRHSITYINFRQIIRTFIIITMKMKKRLNQKRLFL